MSKSKHLEGNNVANSDNQVFGGMVCVCNAPQTCDSVMAKEILMPN